MEIKNTCDIIFPGYPAECKIGGFSIGIRGEVNIIKADAVKK
jgi:hypothetical protein